MSSGYEQFSIPMNKADVDGIFGDLEYEFHPVRTDGQTIYFKTRTKEARDPENGDTWRVTEGLRGYLENLRYDRDHKIVVVRSDAVELIESFVVTVGAGVIDQPISNPFRREPLDVYTQTNHGIIVVMRHGEEVKLRDSGAGY